MYGIPSGCSGSLQERALFFLSPIVSLDGHFLDLDGSVQTQEGGLASLELKGQRGNVLFGELQLNRDVLTQPFEISDGVTIPDSDYRFNRIQTSLALAASRTFSPTLTWTNIVQYDNESRNMGLYSRVRWEFKLGQEIFFVLRQGYEKQDGRGFTNVSGDMTLKIGLTFRF